MEIREYINIIWKRKLLIMLCVILSALVGVLLVFAILSPKYRATAKLLVEPRAKMIVFTGETPRNMPPALDIETYVKMLKSHSVGEMAARKLHEKDKKQPSETELKKEGVNLVERVTVASEEDTGIIRISVDDANPKSCQAIANAYADAFQDISRDMADKTIIEVRRYINKQLKIANTKLNQKSRLLEKFQNRILVTNATTNPDLQEGELNDIIKSLENERMHTQIAEKECEVKLTGLMEVMAQYDASLSGGSASNPGYNNMILADYEKFDGELREYEMQRIELQEKFVEGHPKLVALDNKIQMLTNRKKTLVSNMVQNRSVSSQRYEEVRRAIEEQRMELELTRAKLMRIDEDLVGKRKMMEDVPSLKREKMSLERDLSVAESLKNMLEEQSLQTQLQQVERPNKVRVLDEALEPTSPYFPDRKKWMIITIAFGFIIGIGISFLLEELEETVRTSDDVKNYLNLPVLGSVPYSAETINKLITDVPLKSPIAEAYRRLSFFTQLFCLDPPIKSLLITSSKSDEGKSTTLANMAISMAQEGTKVLIIDTDLRRPMLHRMFGIDNSLGLSSILTGELEAEIAVSDMSLSGQLPKESFMEVVVDRLIQPASIKGLGVIPSGPLPANSIELLRSERMLSFLRTVEKKADIVIFDSPPAIHVIDAVVLSQILDGVLLVINSGRINREEALQVKYMIESTKTPIIGVALNNIEASSPDYYYYYYYGGYGYGSRQRRKRVKLKR